MSKDHSPNFVIVVGASAGGINTVIELCSLLNEQVNAAVFVVLHFTKLSYRQLLINRIQKVTTFQCECAEHEKLIKARHIYLAEPDRHLLLKEDKMILGDGPSESRWRPSIDVLFRSAAAYYNSRVIGIVLTGLMHDGTAGMLAIKSAGGTCIVQHPDEAEYPDMPLSVLQNMEVDYSVPVIEMGAIIAEKTKIARPAPVNVPEDVKTEAAIAERVAIGMDYVSQLGERSLMTCPDCGGGLWEQPIGNTIKYRCHTGHMYTEEDLALKQAQNVEATLWIALRMMEERRVLLEKMSLAESTKGWQKTASNKKKIAKEMERHISNLRELLFETKK